MFLFCKQYPTQIIGKKVLLLTRRNAHCSLPLRRLRLATHPVFVKLMNTNTFSHYFYVDDLANVLDVDVRQLRDILAGCLTGRRRQGYLQLLRSFGIITRKCGSEKAWCLLGLRAIHLSLSPLKAHLCLLVNAVIIGQRLRGHEKNSRCFVTVFCFCRVGAVCNNHAVEAPPPLVKHNIRNVSWMILFSPERWYCE